MAAANVDLTLVGVDHTDDLALEDHIKTGKATCNVISADFVAAGATIEKTQRSPVPRPLFRNEVLKCTDERYCIRIFSEKNYQGIETILQLDPKIPYG